VRSRLIRRHGGVASDPFTVCKNELTDDNQDDWIEVSPAEKNYILYTRYTHMLVTVLLNR
jgi:hypothetical protein